MKTIKPLSSSSDDLNAALLLCDSDPSTQIDSQSDQESSYTAYQEPGVVFKAYNRKAEIFHPMPEDCTNYSQTNESRSFLVRAKSEILPNHPKYYAPIEDRDEDFSSSDRQPSVNSWNLLLRFGRAGSTLPHHGKIWRPVLVKLKGNILKFHAQDFESSPPFKVLHLTWFHHFRIPLKTKFIRDEFLFTTAIWNGLHATRGPLATRGRRWKPAGVKEVKLGCADYDILMDFVATVQKYVSSFPGFRQQGIQYQNEKMLVSVLDIYQQNCVTMKYEQNGITKQEQSNCTIKQEQHNGTTKKVQIMLKAKVSASPECSVHVKHAENFSKMPTLDDISFHKCVHSSSLNSQLVAARFVPLDNCWFQLMSWQTCSSKPPPLHCEVTATLRDYLLEIQARIFTGSTRLEVAVARDLTLRFCAPSEWLETNETERKPAMKTLKECTYVTKGFVSYNSSVNTLLWSLPKISFKPWRNYYLNGKPLATLTTQLRLQPSIEAEMANLQVEMDYFTKGSKKSSEVDIASMKLGLKSFGKFKSNYSSFYHVKIPVTLIKV